MFHIARNKEEFRIHFFKDDSHDADKHFIFWESLPSLNHGYTQIHSDVDQREG